MIEVMSAGDTQVVDDVFEKPQLNYMASELSREDYELAIKNAGSPFSRHITRLLKHQDTDRQATRQLFESLMKQENNYGGKAEIDKLEQIVTKFISDILSSVVTGLNQE